MEDIRDTSPSKILFRSEVFENIDQPWYKLFQFCDPWRESNEELDTLPFTPASNCSKVTSSHGKITATFHERDFHSTLVDPWRSTPGSIISPLTSPRELHDQSGATLESSRRRLFSLEESTAYQGTWKQRLYQLLLVVLSVSVYYFFGKTIVDATSILDGEEWSVSRWHFFQWKMNETLENDTGGALISDTINRPEILFAAHPKTIEASTPMDALSIGSMATKPIRVTFLALQHPRFEIDSLENKDSSSLRRRPTFRTFLTFHIQQQIHWLIPLASTLIPGMGWILILAILSRLAMLGTIPETVGGCDAQK